MAGDGEVQDLSKNACDDFVSGFKGECRGLGEGKSDDDNDRAVGKLLWQLTRFPPALLPPSMIRLGSIPRVAALALH